MEQIHKKWALVKRIVGDTIIAFTSDDERVIGTRRYRGTSQAQIGDIISFFPVPPKSQAKNPEMAAKYHASAGEVIALALPRAPYHVAENAAKDNEAE